MLLSGCYKMERPEKPERFLSEEEMVNVLIDMSLLSSAKGIDKRVLENNGIVPDAYIYKKNNIDSLTFALNNEYYAFDIKKYDAIYAKVKDSLTQLRDTYKAIDSKERAKKKIADSIRMDALRKKKAALKAGEKLTK